MPESSDILEQMICGTTQPTEIERWLGGRAMMQEHDWLGSEKREKEPVKLAGNKRKRSVKRKPERTRPTSPTPVPTKKEIATLAQRVEILNWYHANGENQTGTARYFDKIYPNLRLKQPIICDWVKNEERWRTQWAEAGHKESERTAKRRRQTEHPEVTELMDVWISKTMAEDKLADSFRTGKVLRQMWIRFADLVGVPEDERLLLSNGWLDKFKKRSVLNGEAISVSRERIEKLVGKYGYKVWEIMDYPCDVH